MQERIEPNALDHYIMPTYRRYDVLLERGGSATAFDAQGRDFIDFGAGIGVNVLGFADEGWAAVVGRQAKTLQHVSNLYYSRPQATLARRLCERTSLQRALFCNSGAEANECAIKLARKDSFDRFGRGRDVIVTLEGSFHGRTVTTLSATGQEAFHNYFFPFTEGFRYIPPNDLHALDDALRPDVCAVMIELIQGEGGVLPLERAYVEALAARCKSMDVRLIIDEVQTGVGRTGTLYAYMQYGITPDILTTAKGLGGGLPIGACLCAADLQNVLGPGTHGTTFGGNPVVCAGADYVLSVVDRPDFLAEVRRKGAYLKERLCALPDIEAVRGMGLMLGAQLKDQQAAQVAAACVKEGLLVLTAKTALRFLPPLTISCSEIDEGLRRLARALRNEG